MEKHLKNYIVRTAPACKIWIKGDEVTMLCCLFVSSFLGTCHTSYIVRRTYQHIHTPTQYKLLNQPTPPHTPLLLNTEEKVGLLPGSMQQIPSPCSAIHPWTIHDPCTIGWIGTLLAETGWPSILTSPSSKICWVNCKTWSYITIFTILFFLHCAAFQE